MAAKKQAIAAVAESREQAGRAVENLRRAGFEDAEIGMAHATDSPHVESEDAETEAEGAIAGGLAGGALGTALSGLAVSMVPGIGWVAAGGLLAGLVAGAVAGGVIGASAALEISHEEARYFKWELQSGRTIVVVAPGNREAKALAILRRHGLRSPKPRSSV